MASIDTSKESPVQDGFICDFGCKLSKGCQHPYRACMERRAESDPEGKTPHEPGAKLDAGKNRLGLVLGAFSRALWAVGEVGTYGAHKYSDNGWLQVSDGFARYTDAMYRHQLKEAMGETVDADTDLLHAAHSAWNALARLELILREKEEPSVG